MTIMLQSHYMRIKYQGHNRRKAQALEFWEKVVADYNAGMTAAEISRRYRNPRTGKFYTREHIYWILQQMRENN